MKPSGQLEAPADAPATGPRRPSAHPSPTHRTGTSLDRPVYQNLIGLPALFSSPFKFILSSSFTFTLMSSLLTFTLQFCLHLFTSYLFLFFCFVLFFIHNPSYSLLSLSPFQPFCVHKLITHSVFSLFTFTQHPQVVFMVPRRKDPVLVSPYLPSSSLGL